MNMWSSIQAAALSVLAGVALAAPASAQVSFAPGPKNPGPSNESASGTGIPAIQIQVSVSGTEPAVIQTLTIDNQGTVDDKTDISAAHLYLDLNGNGWVDPGDTALSTNQTYNADDGSVVFANLNRTITVGSSELWLMVVDLSGSASAGESFTCHLGGTQTLSAVGAYSGQSLTITGTSVNSGAKKIDPSHCTLTLVGSLVTRPGGGPLPGATAYPISLLELRASTAQSIHVSSLTWTAFGTGNDLTEVNQVRLFRDGNADRVLTTGTDPEIGGAMGTYNMDDGTAVFASLNETVPAGGRLMLILAYDFASTATPGNTFGAYIANSGDISRCGTAAGHTCSGSCQLHGTPTSHTPVTVQGTTPGPTTTDPKPPKARPHTPSYCCSVIAPLAAGGGGPGGLGGALMLWWPLLLLAAACWVWRDRRRLAVVRRKA